MPFVPPQILGIFNVAILQLLCSLNVFPLLFLCLYIGYILFEMLFFCAHPASALWYFGNFYSFFIFSGNSFWISLVWLSCPLLCFLCTPGRESLSLLIGFFSFCFFIDYWLYDNWLSGNWLQSLESGNVLSLCSKICGWWMLSKCLTWGIYEFALLLCSVTLYKLFCLECLLCFVNL